MNAGTPAGVERLVNPGLPGFYPDPSICRDGQDNYLVTSSGYDPSLFFDDDGRAYLTATREPEGGARFFGDMEIWLQELDAARMRLTGEKRTLWSGSGGIFPEAPHLYKAGGYYYLLLAEGTTFHHHAVTCARSRAVAGPYEPCPHNPMLTHRHLGRAHPIVNAGHGDLVETQSGQWWMALLTSRPYGGFYEPQAPYFGGYYRNLGRETFLAPVVWENGWPVACPGAGRVEADYAAPDLPPHPWAPVPARDDFDGAELSFCWNHLRTPQGEYLSLSERPGWLRLTLKPQTLAEQDNPSLVARRQQHMSFAAATAMEFEPCASGGRQARTRRWRRRKPARKGCSREHISACMRPAPACHPAIRPGLTGLITRTGAGANPAGCLQPPSCGTLLASRHTPF